MAEVIKRAPKMKKSDDIVIVNISGRGDKTWESCAENLKL